MSKKFDCVEMKRKIQAEIYNKTKNMSSEELLVYYVEKSRMPPFLKEISKNKRGKNSQEDAA